MEKIDGAYHLWVNGEFCGVFDTLREVADEMLRTVVPKCKEEQENERTVN